MFRAAATINEWQSRSLTNNSVRMAFRKTQQTQSRRKKILVVDDHAVLREGLVAQINREADLVVCGEAENAGEALAAVEQSKPDLVLADITLPGRNGLELIRDIRALRPGLPVLVLSMHDPSLFAERVLRAGGRGYISKQRSGQRLITAIRHVVSGQIYLSDEMSTRLLDSLSGKRPARAERYAGRRGRLQEGTRGRRRVPRRVERAGYADGSVRPARRRRAALRARSSARS